MAEPSSEKNISQLETIEQKDEEGTVEKHALTNYRALGGIINRKDYEDAFRRMEETTELLDPKKIRQPENASKRAGIQQAENIARYAGIALKGSDSNPDPRVLLYVLLRGDTKSETGPHHSQMSDQQIFGETLRMLEDAESFDKLKRAYPHINFDYDQANLDDSDPAESTSF